MIYFDNASTTPLCEPVIKEIQKYPEHFHANPSNVYAPGITEYYRIRSAGQRILHLLDLDPHKYSIYFTSGATEANNWVLRWANKNRYKILTTGIEHPSVYNTAMDIKKRHPFGVDIIDAKPNLLENCDGIANFYNITNKLEKKSILYPKKLLSVMAVNNQLGTKQQITALGRRCRYNNCLFHVDATQALGHIEIDMVRDCIDFLTGSAHKFGGMKGTGFLICRKDIGLSPMITGGKQNGGMRAGTENVLGIITTPIALMDAMNDLDSKQKKIEKMRDYILSELPKDSYELNGNPFCTVPNIINLSFKDVTGQELATFLEAYCIYVSTNSACESNVEKSNRVLKAFGFSDEQIKGSVRISLSNNNTMEECQEFVKAVKEILDIKKSDEQF